VTDKLVYTDHDILAMLDALLVPRDGDWWNGFYENRAKPCPFFVDRPDESLAEWVGRGTLHPGRALDLGCGNGRNAIFLARHGFTVDAVDYSQKAIKWAVERAAEAGVHVAWSCRSVFDLQYAAGSYDLVYDSGLFHHLPPHRRRTYVERVTHALKPGGWFGLACFQWEGGSGLSDQQVYEHRSLCGGLGYTEERLREIWSKTFDVRVLRPMNKSAPQSGVFGEDFLWALLACKRG
jgi:SAM-dependent methyltransferase